MEPSWIEFERAWTREIVQSINVARDAAGLTIKDLGAKLRGPEVAWPISDATLSGILSGGKRSSISVAEATAFAKALDVPALYLMLGLPAATELPASPVWPVSGDVGEVLSWMTGRIPVQGEMRGPSMQLARLEDHQYLLYQVRWQMAQLKAVEEVIDSGVQVSARWRSFADPSDLLDLLTDLYEVRVALSSANHGSVRPTLPPELLFVDEQRPSQWPPLVDVLPTLEAIVTDRELEQARRNFREWVGAERPDRPGRSSRAAAADSAE